MTVQLPRVKIETPTGDLPPGRGFYQLEEDSLYVPIGQRTERHFFSWLESELVRFDIDRKGRLMLIEIQSPRRSWKVDPKLSTPRIGEPADIRWLDFRSSMTEPELITNPDRSSLKLSFGQSKPWHWYTLAKSVLVQIDQADRLTAVMITDISDDVAGSKIAAFRRELAAQQTALRS